MKIVFFGSSSFSIPVLSALIASPHKIKQVVTTPDRKKGRGQKFAPSEVKTFTLTHNLPVLDPEKLSAPAVREAIKALEPEFLIVASYGKKIPASIFTLPKIASLNVHPSLLPKYRGASPIQAAILGGEKETGVSIFSLTDKLDAGDVFGQTTTKIGENENASTLSTRLAQLGAGLLLEIIKQFELGVATRTSQDESKATYASRIEKNSGQINWIQPADQIHNQVRAYFPWPSAFTFFHGKRLKILETQLLTNSGQKNPVEAGTILGPSGKRLLVQTGTHAIALVQVQMEGARPMEAGEFVRGYRIRSDEKFDHR